MKENPNNAKRMSLFLIAIISVLLALSFFSLYQVIETYRMTGSSDLISIVMSASAIGLTTYIIFQINRKPLKLGFETPKVYSKIMCSVCDFSEKRMFQLGDYVLKDEKSCPKCKGTTFVSVIYRETINEDK